MTPKFKSLALGAALMFTANTTLAQGTYNTALKDQFGTWCTGEGYSAQVCGCSIDKAMAEISSTDMSTFLTAATGGSMASVSTNVGAKAMQIVSNCAAPAGSAAGNAMKSIGTMLGK